MRAPTLSFPVTLKSADNQVAETIMNTSDHSILQDLKQKHLNIRSQNMDEQLMNVILWDRLTVTAGRVKM